MSAVEKSTLLDELRWTLTRIVKDGTQQRQEDFNFDLTALSKGYSAPFLLALKKALINSRNRMSPVTILTDHICLKSLLLKCQQAGIMSTVVEKIDLPFIAALETIKHELKESGLKTLKRFFKANRSDDRIFAVDLRPEDFPRIDSPVGAKGKAIKRILSRALSRGAMSLTLTAVEDAFEAGQVDIGHYSFALLAFQVFFRPESYRQLRLKDLHQDKNKETGEVTWFIDLLPVKTGVDNPSRLTIKITSDLGETLKLQQMHVRQRYGHLVAESDFGNLALFPARQLKVDGTWGSKYASQNRGLCSRTAILKTYLKPIEKLARQKLSFIALRHTVGTQLALAGLSASRIAAVLRHASDNTCQNYVDLFFQGVLDRISDAMQPSFDEHFPVYKEVLDRAISKRDPIPREKAIVSEDAVTGRREVTAACGRQSLCGFAPLACYNCNKFRPCWDADHSINLDVVNREISDFEGQGLAMQHEVQKFKHLRNAIRVVISICELKLRIADQGERP